MKRVIEGQTYNTDTAVVVAKYEYVDDKGYDVEAVLYQTRGGAFFIVHRWTAAGDPKFHFEAITRDEVSRLVQNKDNLEIIDETAIAEPPEAAAEPEPGATLYVRVPASLKSRVDEAARLEDVSGNAWAMKCMERCLSLSHEGDLPELGLIWNVASEFNAHKHEGEWTRETAIEALCDIADWAGKVIDRLGFSTGNYVIDDDMKRDLVSPYDAFDKRIR